MQCAGSSFQVDKFQCEGPIIPLHLVQYPGHNFQVPGSIVPLQLVFFPMPLCTKTVAVVSFLNQNEKKAGLFWFCLLWSSTAACAVSTTAPGAVFKSLLPFADEVPAQKTETGAPKQKDEPLQSETHENGSKDHQKKLPPVCHSYVC